MREIKFRAWKKTGAPEMFTDIAYIDFNRKVVGINYKVSDLTTRVDEEPFDNVELLPYTGLKDKNESDIYDQDKLYHAHTDEYGYVESNEGCYYAVFGNIKTQLSEICDEVEVVGSVLEESEQTEERTMNRKYALYSTRKKDTPYPKNFAKVEITTNNTWIITEGVLEANELNRCDLVYHGHGMTYETTLKEIDRLERSNMNRWKRS